MFIQIFNDAIKTIENTQNNNQGGDADTYTNHTNFREQMNKLNLMTIFIITECYKKLMN